MKKIKTTSHYVVIMLITLTVGLTFLLASGCSNKEELQAYTWGRADAKEIDLTSKIPGRVTEILVKEGDTVKAGQVLARIDNRDLLMKKAQLEASIAAAQAQQQQAAFATTIQAGVTASDLEAARTKVNQAKADMEMTGNTLERYKQLYAEGAIPKQTYESIETKYRVSVETLRQAESAVAKAEAATMQTDVSRATEIAAARNVEQAKAGLAQLEIALGETEIRAPFDGVITTKYVEEGSMVSQGMPLVAIQNPQDNWVDFKVPETALSDFSLHQKVTLVGRDGKTKVDGIITDISKKAEFATQRASSERGDATDIISFNVKIQVNSETLRPGMRFKIESR